jgi:5-formyltetrahydrofolate cyclo-ligase
MSEDKKALRRQLAAEIEAFPAAYIAESDAGIYKRIVDMPEFTRARVIFSYYSLGREVDTVRFLRYALEAGKTVTLPVCFKGGIMEARAVSCLEELTRSDYGLLEPLKSERVVLPEALDFIVVPALAYDRDGYRLGWGGGYYDRYLLRTGAFRAGIGRHRLLRERLPREAHDVPVDCVVTEKRRDSKAEPRLSSG